MQRVLDWLGGHEAGVLLIFAAVSGILLTGAALSGDAFDPRILLSMRDPATLAPLGPPALIEAAIEITALGSLVLLTLFTVIAAGYLALEGSARTAGLLCASLAGAEVAATLLRNVFNRPRPAIVPHLTWTSGASFPSGHAMMSAAVYLTLGVLLAGSHDSTRTRAYILITSISLTVIVGITRVYLGVHWPTDVLGGWVAGAFWALLVWVIHAAIT